MWYGKGVKRNIKDKFYGGDLLKYELKSFFQSKVILVSLFISILLGIQILVLFLQGVNQRGWTYHQKYYERLEANQEEDIRVTEDQWDYTMSLCTTEEKKQVFLNEYKYMKWIRDYSREIVDYGNSEEYDPEIYHQMIIRSDLINALASCNTCASPDTECPDVETYFAEEFERHKEFLRLDELPFQLSLLADSPFMTPEQKEKNIPYYYQYRAASQTFLGRVEHEKVITVFDASPWSYLQKVFSRYEYPGIIFGCIAILLPAFYMVQCRKNRTLQLQQMIPRKQMGIVGHYYSSVLVGVILLFVAGIGLITLGMGIRYGWGGLETPTYVDPVNFTSMTTEYNAAPEAYGFRNLGKVYSDVCVDGEEVYSTMYELKEIPLWKMLGYAGVLSVVKVLFLTLLGFSIGYLCQRNGIAVFLAVLMAGVYVMGQVTKKGMKWNPLAVKSSWDVAVGGCNTTWFNGMVVLTVSIILLGIVLLWFQKKRKQG